MHRIRTIKPEFFLDEDLAELSAVHRLAFIGLWCYADRKGRLEDRPKFLKAVLFPYDPEVDMEKVLNDLSGGRKRFISKYEVNGKRYIQIINFLKHQTPNDREKASEIPGPNGEIAVIGDYPNKRKRKEIYERDEYQCVYCGEDMKEEKRKLCIDYVIPLSKGGTHSANNLVTCCKRCYGVKRGKTPEEAEMKWPEGYGDIVDGELTVNERSVNGGLTGGKDGVNGVLTGGKDRVNKGTGRGTGKENNKGKGGGTGKGKGSVRGKGRGKDLDAPGGAFVKTSEEVSTPPLDLGRVPFEGEKKGTIKDVREGKGIGSLGEVLGVNPGEVDNGGSNGKERTPVRELISLYHECCPSLPRVRKIPPCEATLKNVRARWKEKPSLSWFEAYFKQVEESDFLTGRRSAGEVPFVADFAWLMRPTNMEKVINGRYVNRKVPTVWDRL